MLLALRQAVTQSLPLTPSPPSSSPLTRILGGRESSSRKGDVIFWVWGVGVPVTEAMCRVLQEVMEECGTDLTGAAAVSMPSKRVHWQV